MGSVPPHESVPTQFFDFRAHIQHLPTCAQFLHTPLTRTIRLGPEVRSAMMVPVLQVSVSQVRFHPVDTGNTGEACGSPTKASCEQFERGCLHREGQLAAVRNGVHPKSSCLPQRTRQKSYSLAMNRTSPAHTMSQLYTDDGALSRAETLGDQAAVQQLYTWTAQILQQLLRSATAAKVSAQQELEIKCQELCDIQARYATRHHHSIAFATIDPALTLCICLCIGQAPRFHNQPPTPRCCSATSSLSTELFRATERGHLR